jgi:hypothetical protein
LSDDPEEEAKQRTFTSLINKLTIENFDKIVMRMGDIDVSDAKTLKGFVTKIFNKALTESIFCEMYASLCKELLRIMPRYEPSNQDAAACCLRFEPKASVHAEAERITALLCQGSDCEQGWMHEVVCRFETEVLVGNDHKKKIHQDIRSLVLSECQYQFGLGRSAKNAEVNPEDESGTFHGLFCSASCITMLEDVQLSRGPARPGSNPGPAERHLSSFIRAAR